MELVALERRRGLESGVVRDSEQQEGDVSDKITD